MILGSARILIAGTHSGCGKTTATLALLGALHRRGLRLPAVKSGPDYIDPGHHAQMTGRPGRNLDTWMFPDAAVRELFRRASSDADVAVIEGAMGLYDGHGACDERGSAAHLSKILDCPVLLVLDGKGMGRSAAAMALGYARFDPNVRLAGILLNNVSGESHYGYLRPEIEAAIGIPVVGYLPRDPEVRVGERHLGLEPAAEGGLAVAVAERLADQAAATVDLDRVLSLAAQAPPLPDEAPVVFTGPSRPSRVRIAVARDRAFHFYYQDNLDLLAHLGAECVPFSPIEEDHLPAGVHLLYLGGGYPEVHAAQLAANECMRDAIRDWAEADRPVYGECGGLMYLCRSLVTADGQEFPMAGVLPARTRMEGRRVALGYTTITLQRDCLLGAAGTTFRAHEFHWSSLERLGPVDHAFCCQKRAGKTGLDGLAHRHVLAGYPHVHFAAHPALARALVDAALRQKERDDANGEVRHGD